MDSNDPAEKKALSQGLVDEMLNSLCPPDPYFKDMLDEFLPFWMWG
jgi:hypothetical protein